jgi:hypothetical protein
MDPIVAAALIAGAASVVVALIGLFGVIIPRLWHNTRSLHEVKEQITNSHGSNLRDDLDFIRDNILDMRADIGWVRRDHLDLTRRVDTIEGDLHAHG